MSFPSLDISSTEKCLILFADVIDSSKYSAVLGVREYGKELLRFKREFNELALLYFPEVNDKVIAYSLVEARGDEGVVFYIPEDTETYPDLIFRAIQFAFELKAILEILSSPTSSGSLARAMRIGVGIHFGDVATATGPEKVKNQDRYQSVIQDVMGYEINYGKRLESCSRAGKYSNIFLSKDAISLLDGFPLVYHKHQASLKNIHNNEDVFEVMSAFFEVCPFSDKWSRREQLLNAYCGGTNGHLSFLKHPWQKGLAISILNSRLEGVHSESLRRNYSEKLSEIAWGNPVETDPILLYRRAMECRATGKLTQSARYLNEILRDHPYFIHAKIKLIRTCWEISQNKTETSEKIYARDIADEYLTKYSEYLDEEEKELCKAIIEA